LGEERSANREFIPNFAPIPTPGLAAAGLALRKVVEMTARPVRAVRAGDTIDHEGHHRTRDALSACRTSVRVNGTASFDPLERADPAGKRHGQIILPTLAQALRR
jgi:hypothetical protein